MKLPTAGDESQFRLAHVSSNLLGGKTMFPGLLLSAKWRDRKATAPAGTK
jgi:hypothetical protein